MKYRAVLLIGAPGSGKGTQGRILGQIPNFCYFSCGDVFRELSPRTAMGRTFMEYSSNGRLAPDSLTIDLWKKTLNAKQQSGDFSPEDDVLVLFDLQMFEFDLPLYFSICPKFFLMKLCTI